MDKSAASRTIDPILQLPCHSQVTSISFVSQRNSFRSSAHPDRLERLHSNSVDNAKEKADGPENHSQSSDDNDDNDNIDDDDDDDDDIIGFRSSNIRLGGPSSVSSYEYSRRLLADRFLASCHINGEALLWDLKNQRPVATISPPRGGSGVCVRRTDDPSLIMFQTRDPKGTVSLHPIERCHTEAPNCSPFVSSTPSVHTQSSSNHYYETYSRTFCRAAPCLGNHHLLALPNVDHSTVTIVDNRTDATVAKHKIENHGMVTSLALTLSDSHSDHCNGRPILACGMESGTIFFFDSTYGSTKPFHKSSFSIGKDPVLTLDAIPSSSVKSADGKKYSASLLVAAGMAGDAQDVSELSVDEAGRAVIFKSFCTDKDNDDSQWHFKQRARLSTCRVDRESYGGKPGVSICRFRPQGGRLLAVGSWDRRIRLFERSKGNMMAVLKGGTGSIVDLDWAPDSASSGLLASVDKDDKLIRLWQCFAN